MTDTKTIDFIATKSITMNAPTETQQLQIKKPRARKYATPEEAHAAKLEHMKAWREKKKAEKLAKKEAMELLTESPDEPIKDEPSAEYNLVLKFNSAQERDLFIEKFQK